MRAIASARMRPSRVRRASRASGTTSDAAATRAVPAVKSASPNAGTIPMTAAMAPASTTQPLSFFCHA